MSIFLEVWGFQIMTKIESIQFYLFEIYFSPGKSLNGYCNIEYIENIFYNREFKSKDQSMSKELQHITIVWLQETKFNCIHFALILFTELDGILFLTSELKLEIYLPLSDLDKSRWSKFSDTILWSLPSKMSQSRPSLQISHWLYEKILMSNFRWLAQKKL